jgi:hypothetical protein
MVMDYGTAAASVGLPFTIIQNASFGPYNWVATSNYGLQPGAVSSTLFAGNYTQSNSSDASGAGTGTGLAAIVGFKGVAPPVVIYRIE